MNFSKLLINNQHNSPHQLRHLSNLQQHQHPVRQITPQSSTRISLQENPYLFEKDTQYYQNFRYPYFATHL